ncbi:MAG: SDR family NAD(P)-dependent oxidoreductase [Candidatus Limnocylindrales bacterium]
MALITGGSDGVGSGCARVFVEAGATVVINSRTGERGGPLAAQLSAAGPGTCEFVACDVSDTAALRNLVEQVVGRHGRLDTLVNNAGQNFGYKPIDELEVDDFVRLLGINLVPYFATAKFALPHLRATRGSIVNIGSVVAETGFFWNPDYVATKGGISALTRALAIDEAGAGVRVNAVLPGNVMTRRRASLEAEAVDGGALHDFMESWQWLGGSGQPEDVGYAVLFLASRFAGFITGATLTVSGGIELGMGPKRPYSELFHT